MPTAGAKSDLPQQYRIFRRILMDEKMTPRLSLLNRLCCAVLLAAVVPAVADEEVRVLRLIKIACEHIVATAVPILAGECSCILRLDTLQRLFVGFASADVLLNWRSRRGRRRRRAWWDGWIRDKQHHHDRPGGLRLFHEGGSNDAKNQAHIDSRRTWPESSKLEVDAKGRENMQALRAC